MRWINSGPTSFGKDNSAAGESAILDKQNARQTLFIDYSYDLSPNFDSLRVIAQMLLANKELSAQASAKNAKPTDRLKNNNLAYGRPIIAVVKLPNADHFNMSTNAASWSSNGGWIIKGALTKGFASIAALTPRTLALTDAEVKTMNSKSHQLSTVAGLIGRLVSGDLRDGLIWSDGFVSVQPAW